MSDEQKSPTLQEVFFASEMIRSYCMEKEITPNQALCGMSTLIIWMFAGEPDAERKFKNWHEDVFGSFFELLKRQQKESLTPVAPGD